MSKRLISRFDQYRQNGKAVQVYISGDGSRNPRWLNLAQSEKTAERVAACLNACEGINPEAVPEMLGALKSVALRMKQGAPSEADLAKIAEIVFGTITKAEAK